MGDVDDALAGWCERIGIAAAYHDIWGHRHEASDAGRRALLAEFGIEDTSVAALARVQEKDASALPPVIVLDAGTDHIALSPRLGGSTWSLLEERGAAHAGVLDPSARIAITLPEGYHELDVEGHGNALVIVAPSHCFRPDAVHGERRAWGPALQLYSLRSERNWGMGDFGDLAAAIDLFAQRGADLVGLNPLHALFLHNPAHVSPYSPSSRSQLNVLYLDVEAIDDFADCAAARALAYTPTFQARLERLRASEQVDYVGVAEAKFAVLAHLYAHFREQHLRENTPRAARFRAFQLARGQSLRLHATFEALQSRFHAADASVWGWPVWPAEYRDPESAAVKRFQIEALERIEYFEYLQWQADEQLAALSRRCRARGTALGLYLDLAVSVDRGGSDTWGEAALFAPRASVGAPPDEVNVDGQDWGLPPPRPDRLRDARYRLFIDTLRACMRHAGALRIDHVMSLMRLYWIPSGHSAREGAYVHYPLRDLMAIVALESRRQRCMVIGEDLGTVADEMRAALAEREVLSYRLLMFERTEDGSFKAPRDYPRNALVAISTHDLPTLAGWWQGDDLRLRLELGLAGEEHTREQLHLRARDRMLVLQALQREGVYSGDASADTPLTPALAEVIHAYVANTPSLVMVLQLEDALGLREQANLPGTVNEHPNWRRKLPVSMSVLAREPQLQSLCELLARLRPRAPVAAQAAIPRATYRLQFNAAFRFDDAIRVLPFLARLGVSHVYCSPLMRARAGSTHGYDVVAHDQINPELGGPEGFERFSDAARALGMSLLLDMVPNHMGVGADNAWWQHVLQHGPASPYARWFDIDWHPPDPEMQGKVLLPVLGDPYGRVISSGQLRLQFDASTGAFVLRYFDHVFPLAPHSTAAFDTNDIDGTLARHGTPEAIHALHEAQHYRLAFWRVASDEINYRRFFDINDLAALRIEEPEVFEATQGFALDLAAAGRVAGLRIDHPDGLLDPAQYFRRLQQGFARRLGVSMPEHDDDGRPSRPLYVVAEKIAAAHEDVPEDWALHGTTGYRFANVVNGVLVDTEAAGRFDRIWRHFSGRAQGFEDTAVEGKRVVMRSALASDLTMLTGALLRIARAHRDTRDFSFGTLRVALADVAAHLPVYRSYVVDEPSTQDRRFIEWSVARARARSEATDPAVFDFVRNTLLAQPTEGADEALRERVRQFARRFQQFTAPVCAKGVEDTAFYRYHRLVSLNEVGGDPGTFGLSVRAFHAASADRAARWPHTILASSTHDNKRSEDVRARLDVLSEMPAAWKLTLRPFATDDEAPSRADRYLLLQTLLGTLPAGGLDEHSLPAYRERIELYALKAAREAKQHTRWTNPNEAYEQALREWVGRLLARVHPNPPLTELQARAEVLAWFGALNTLSMVVLKFMSPGVPDIYQGNELLDLRLVDPDNRRAVDYMRRAELLDACEALATSPGDWCKTLAMWLRAPHDGRLKLWCTWRLLQLRRREEALLRDSGYRALTVQGTAASHVVAFARERGARRVIVIVGRLYARLMGAETALPVGEATWHDTRVELGNEDQGAWRNWLTGETMQLHDRVELAHAFACLPVAVLVREQEDQ